MTSPWRRCHGVLRGLWTGVSGDMGLGGWSTNTDGEHVLRTLDLRGLRNQGVSGMLEMSQARQRGWGGSTTPPSLGSDLASSQALLWSTY